MMELVRRRAAAVPNPAHLPMLAIALLTALCGVFLWRLYTIARFAGWAVAYPYELDYGEGIVWEQMRRIVAGQGYGQIAELPGIVFHYPPVFHLTSYALAFAAELDELAAGRAVSLLALASVAAIGASLVFSALRAETGPRTAWFGAAGAVGVLLGCWPIIFWTPVMRVDMLAIAWSFAGIWFAISAMQRPRLVHAAALCFVLSLFTKQTMVAAPAAGFFVLFLVRPRIAIVGIGTALALGLCALAGLQWATDGGFARHIFGNNLNRFELHRLGDLAMLLGCHGIYIGVGAFVLQRRLRPLAAILRKDGLVSLRARILTDRASSAFLFLAAYLTAATPMLLLFGKSGSNVNYMIEWFCVLALIIGLGARELIGLTATASPRLVVLLVLALVTQALIISPRTSEKVLVRAPDAEMSALTNLVRASDKPVISDDMVLLLRGGKHVVWESSIFAELASVARYDERPFVKRVREGRFGFFVTFRERGEKTFDSRYTPAVADAMDAAYPVKVYMADLTLHLPPRCADARATLPCP